MDSMQKILDALYNYSVCPATLQQTRHYMARTASLKIRAGQLPIDYNRLSCYKALTSLTQCETYHFIIRRKRVSLP